MMDSRRFMRRLFIAVGITVCALAFVAMARQPGNGTRDAQASAIENGNVTARETVDPLYENGGLDFGRIVAFATNSVFLKKNAVVVSGEVVVNDASDGPTLSSQVELTVGDGATTPAGFAVRGDSVKVKVNGVVGGDIYANEVDNNGQINGNAFTLDLPVFAQLPAFKSGPVGTGGDPPPDILVPQNGFLTLAPGDYGEIQVKKKGAVVFTGGEYSFTNFNFGDATSMFFVTPTEIRIADKFDSGQNSYIGPDPDAAITAADIVFYVAGVNGNNGNLGSTPKAVKVGLNNDVFANFYAPNGTVYLRQNTHATGAFVGRDVQIGIRVEITLDSAFFNRAPTAVDDSATVAAGGTATELDSLALSLLDNDSDPEGGGLSVTTTPVTPPAHGSLVLNSDGTFSYTHDGGSAESDFFVYEVCDDGQPMACSQATVSIAIIQAGVVVTILKEGDGDGVIGSSPSGLNCGVDCVASFPATGAIFLSADPDANSIFTGWTGDLDCEDGILNPDGDKTCIANFEPKPPPPAMITVTVVKSGSGDGEVQSRPSGIDCGEDCVAAFPQFGRILLEATADANSEFVGWDGDADCSDGVLDAADDTNCIAIFNQVVQPPETVTLQVVVTGEGTVASNPPGILCSDDCTADFDINVTARLSARANPGWSFAGWGGDCSGTAFFTDILMDSNKGCTATFVQQ